MATASTANRSTSDKDSSNSTSKSYFQKTVCLKDWWLVKAEKNSDGNRLAVAGITSREKQAVRVFSSAPILRRYDVFTLETVDGISIIIKGFLNKARTQENGFPSEVCDHFVFGFPPYWETYALNYSEGEPFTMDAAPSIPDSGSLSPQAGRGNRDFSYHIPQNHEMFSSEETGDNLCKKKSSMKDSSVGCQKETRSDLKAPEDSERETSQKDVSVENKKTLEASENSPGNSARQPSAPSGLEENDVPSSEQNNVSEPKKDNYYSSTHILKHSTDYNKEINVSACVTEEIKDYNSSSKAIEEPRKVKSSKKSSRKIDFSREMVLADEIADRYEGTRSTNSLSKMQRKWKDNASGHWLQSNLQSDFLITQVTGSEEIENARANTEKESRARSISSLPGTGIQDLADEMTPRTPDCRFTEDDSCHNHRICYTDEDTKDQNNKCHSRKASKSNEAHSSSGFCKVEKGKKKNAVASEQNISQLANLSRKKARRIYETRASWKEKDESSSIASPESLSLNRSRSGRLLLPTLEFWRNQRAIYDADRQITGIKDLQINQPSKGVDLNLGGRKGTRSERAKALSRW